MIKSIIFQSVTDEEIKEIEKLQCFRTKNYKKNEIIFHMGDLTKETGIVIKGSVNIENIDLWGNKIILNNISTGQLFAETYALCNEPMMVQAVSNENSEILFLNIATLTDSRFSDKTWYKKILLNITKIAAQKNLSLSNRIFCTSSKTIRGRLSAYLSYMSVKNKSTTFQIPFNRQQLADYLNLDRSALSKELGKMQKEGLLEFYKNSFKLKNI